jgi:hypothetical protein
MRTVARMLSPRAAWALQLASARSQLRSAERIAALCSFSPRERSDETQPNSVAESRGLLKCFSGSHEQKLYTGASPAPYGAGFSTLLLPHGNCGVDARSVPRQCCRMDGDLYSLRTRVSRRNAG